MHRSFATGARRSASPKQSRVSVSQTETLWRFIAELRVNPELETGLKTNNRMKKLAYMVDKDRLLPTPGDTYAKSPTHQPRQMHRLPAVRNGLFVRELRHLRHIEV
eukprot:gene47115-63098_t